MAEQTAGYEYLLHQTTKDANTYLRKVLGRDLDQQISRLPESDLLQLASIVRRPDIQTRVNKSSIPYGIVFYTTYGTIYVDDSLTNIDSVWVNGASFSTTENGLQALEKLVSGYDSTKEILERKGSRRHNRGRNIRVRNTETMSLEDLQAEAEVELQSSGLTYETLFPELTALLDGRPVQVSDVADEIFANDLDESEIASFLVYDSSFKNDIIAQVMNLPLPSIATQYEFETVQADTETFVGRLLTAFEVEEAEYDRKNGALKIGERMITNLPYVDEDGIFYNGDKRYIPYHIGYFADGEPGDSRVDRIRHIDPVQSHIDAVRLHYDLTSGNVKFKTILDVSRNLPDFAAHPDGEAILATYKGKLVFDKGYMETNNVLTALDPKNTDSLGNVATVMSDEDAAGVLDPYGTSNGANLGYITYLSADAKFLPDGTIERGTEIHSKVGQILKDNFADFDNFNRNQMSFNALLTSMDRKQILTYYAEMAMLNAEDGNILTPSGAKEVFNSEKFTGDKLQCLHGNKGVTNVFTDSLDDETIRARKLENMMEFIKLNPHVQLISSPISIASRENMGVIKEGVASPIKEDVTLLDGSIVKDGAVLMNYLSLPQTAEHKSKDYAIEGNGRRYSTLFRQGLQSKVGEELYRAGLIDEGVRNKHIDEISTNFQRLGVSFKDESQLFNPSNARLYVEAPVSMMASDFRMTPAAEIRRILTENMVDGQINIILPDNMPLTSEMLDGEEMKDEFGNNILPIRVGKTEHFNLLSGKTTVEYDAIPYRYMPVFNALAVSNPEALQNNYAKAVSVEFKQLTRKDNIIKDLDTMTFTDDAATLVIVPDPSLKLGEVRTDGFVLGGENRDIIHRDPVIWSGNVISVEDIGHADKKVLHVNPLIMKMIDGDYDGDTMGKNGYDNLNLEMDTKEAFYYLSNVYEQINYYGEVFLGTDSSHFVAGAKAAGLDISNINFEDGRTKMDVAHMVEDIQDRIMQSPDAYGAYGLSFTNEETATQGLCRLAEDGIKGNVEAIRDHMSRPYTREENVANSSALQGKTVITPLAGMITNNFIADTSDREFDAELTRVGLDITHSQTQAVLQMKKSPEKLEAINNGIREMKTIFSGKYDTETSRTRLKSITNGLVPDEAVDKFVDLVASRQRNPEKFGSGVLKVDTMTTTKLAFTSGTTFAKSVKRTGKTSMKENMYVEQAPADQGLSL